jgi:hypothetical protein
MGTLVPFIARNYLDLSGKRRDVCATLLALHAARSVLSLLNIPYPLWPLRLRARDC